MSLGRKLSLDARATFGPDERGVARSGRKDEPVPRSHRDSSAVAEYEIDRAAGAVKKFRVVVLVLAVPVARRVRPPIHVTGLAAQRGLDRVWIGRRKSTVPTVLDLHGCHDATVRVGVVYPHQEIGDDPARIAAFAQAAEDLGYAHIVAYDHVLGADPANRPTWWKGAYTHHDAFHEPFVLFGYLAAITKKLELAFGIVILPQRQTALVAKQAATLDVLSRGRVRFGAGIGWNHVEYEGLGMNWRDRAKRVEEQIELLRLLWTEELVDYTGRWHRIDRAGIKPLPVQRPIPIWMGADEEVAVKRVARLGDGWFSHLAPNEEGRAALERFRGYVREAGRDPDRIGVEGRVAATGSPDEWARKAEIFRDMGMTHLELRTAASKLPDLDAHLAAMRRFREVAPVF
jgi:probable F420-dependent oxidoreductase